MPTVEIVASAENTWYQMWQAMLFHFSCVKHLGQAPVIVVHHDGEPLRGGFELIAKRGGRIQAAPNYRAHQGVSYPPRNTAGSLRHVETEADFVFLCDPDMLFLRSVSLAEYTPAENQVSFDEVSYLTASKAEFADQLETICERAGASLQTLIDRPISGGVPHMIPRALQQAVSQDWFDVMEFFPTFDLGPNFEKPKELPELPHQFWTTTMWALVLTVHRLHLEPVLTRHCLLNLHGNSPLPAPDDRFMLHYCYSNPTFDKRLYYNVRGASRTVWNLPTDNGTISGAVRGQLHEARDYYDIKPTEVLPMIMPGHVPIWRRLFNGPLSATGSWITIGVQDVHEAARHEADFNFPNLTELLQSRGIAVETLDWFDPRANHRHDLNHPLPAALRENFDVLLDIGTIEHVFDTRQVFINYLSLVKLGGDLCLHLPVSGYYRHGLHTFSPDLVRGALLDNGCEISFTEFTDHRGQPVSEDNLRGVDALLWIVARKTKSVAEFHNPQQIGWQDYYDTRTK